MAKNSTGVLDKRKDLSTREILKCFESEDKEIILMGDTNSDLKSSKNPNAKTLKQLYREYQFEQIITDYAK